MNAGSDPYLISPPTREVPAVLCSCRWKHWASITSEWKEWKDACDVATRSYIRFALYTAACTCSWVVGLKHDKHIHQTLCRKRGEKNVVFVCSSVSKTNIKVDSLHPEKLEDASTDGFVPNVRSELDLCRHLFLPIYWILAYILLTS